MNICIYGANFRNKGAELMLRAVVQYLNQHVPDARVAMAPTGLSQHSYRQRARLGLYQEVSPRNWGRLRCYIPHLIPARVRVGYGLLLDGEMDALLDISGYAYGDVWGLAQQETAARQAEYYTKRGRIHVLMPQAFGPFDDPDIRVSFRRLCAGSSVVFARDGTSLNHVKGVLGENNNVRLAPDFTCLYSGHQPETPTIWSHRVALLPNKRMCDMPSVELRERYAGFISAVVNAVRQAGAEPVWLLHECCEDRPVVDELNKALSKPPDVVEELDIGRLKGILGACYVVVGARYHGLVSALSQGVPCVGCGWSHKYAALFEEYACPECLLSVDESAGRIEEAVGSLFDSTRHAELADRLRAASECVCEGAEAMWRIVLEVLSERND